MPDHMGEVLVRVKVSGPSGTAELEDVLVDSGALHSMITRSVADSLGIRPEAHIRFRIVGGHSTLPLGTAILEIVGKRFRVPVILGDLNLVGLTTLEILGLTVDPIDQKLVEKPGFIYPVDGAGAATA